VYFLQLRTTNLNKFSTVSINDGIQALNVTIDYTQINLAGSQAALGEAITFPHGFMISALGETNVFAVKADQGTTDGYLVSVLTNYSMEFYIAGWP
jgi:hypothetical protein